MTGATATLASLARQSGPSLPPVGGGGRVVAFDGTVIEAEGIDDTPIGAAARVGAAGRPAQLIGFRDGRARLMTLVPMPELLPGAMVRPGRADADCGVGAALRGRVIDGFGRAIDGGPALRPQAFRPLDPSPLDPGRRARVERPLATGIRVIDTLMTLGIGQRVGLLAGSGVGKSVLIGQIARTAEADTVVVALIGERGREIADFVGGELAGTARQRIVTVAVPADAAPLLRIAGARRALAIAEAERDAGRHAIVVLDSLTRVVHAQRDVAIARGEPLPPRGLPASALALIAGLLERGGGDRISGGAVTLVATVLADADNMNDPIVDAARGVLDGHIVLSRALASRGIWPAIEIAQSLSRVMADVVDPAHAADAATVRRMVALCEENRDLVLMGAYAPGSDAAVDAALVRGPAIEAFRCQRRDESVAFAAARAALAELAA